MMIKQGTVLEIRGRTVTVTAVSIYDSTLSGKMEARVEFVWDATGAADSTIGSRLIEAIRDGDIVLVAA